MKQLLSILTLGLVTSISAQAQTLRGGVEAGFDLSTPKSETENAKAGFHVGATLEYKFNDTANKGWYGATGIFLSNKGATSDDYYVPNNKVSASWKSTNYWLTIPVHIGYKIPVSKAALLLEAGPYIGVGLFGNNKVEYAGKSTTVSHNVFKDNLYDRFDWGLGVKAGVQFCKHYQVSLGYDFGLQNLSTNKDLVDYKNRTFTASVSYIF